MIDGLIDCSQTLKEIGVSEKHRAILKDVLANRYTPQFINRYVAAQTAFDATQVQLRAASGLVYPVIVEKVGEKLKSVGESFSKDNKVDNFTWDTGSGMRDVPSIEVNVFANSGKFIERITIGSESLDEAYIQRYSEATQALKEYNRQTERLRTLIGNSSLKNHDYDKKDTAVYHKLWHMLNRGELVEYLRLPEPSRREMGASLPEYGALYETKEESQKREHEAGMLEARIKRGIKSGEIRAGDDPSVNPAESDDEKEAPRTPDGKARKNAR